MAKGAVCRSNTSTLPMRQPCTSDIELLDDAAVILVSTAAAATEVTAAGDVTPVWKVVRWSTPGRRQPARRESRLWAAAMPP